MFEIEVEAVEGIEVVLWVEAGLGKRTDLWTETVPEPDFEQNVVFGLTMSFGTVAEEKLEPGDDLELVPEFVKSAGRGRAGLEFVHRFGVEAEPVLVLQC